MRTCFCAWLALCLSSSGAVFIGSEAARPLHPSAKYSSIINVQPGVGESVSNNPPMFSWIYQAKDWWVSYPFPSTDSQMDATNYTFHLIMSTNGPDMSSPFVDTFREFNSYAWTPELPRGATSWWSVAWHVTSNTNIVVKRETNHFYVTPSATILSSDRSQMANPSAYLTNLTHPYIWFKASNQIAMGTWLFNNFTTSANAISNDAKATVASAWFTNPASWTPATDSKALNVAFMWVTTSNLVWITNGNLSRVLSNYANFYITNNYGAVDTIGSSGPLSILKTIALGYDWCFDILNTAQRSNIVWALEDRALGSWKNNAYQEGATLVTEPVGGIDATRTWASGFETYLHAGATKHGSTSHSIQVAAETQMSWLACLPESSIARTFADFYWGFMLYKGEDMGGFGAVNEGMGYGSGVITEHNQILWLACANQFVPGLKLDQAFHWQQQATWWQFMTPVGYGQTHEPWGDTGNSEPFSVYPRSREFQRLAQFTQSGSLLRYCSNWWVLDSLTAFNYASDTFDAIKLPAEYYSGSGQIYTNPTIASQTNRSIVFDRAGYAMAGSTDPTDATAWKNGVGMAFVSRPRGQDVGHGNPVEGDFMLYAYGSAITDTSAHGVADAFNKFPISHNVPVVNGWLQGYAKSDYAEEARGYINGYESGSNYVFFSADLTKSWPRTFLRSQIAYPYPQDSRYEYQYLSITNVSRSVLFVRNKFWMFSDHLQCSTATNVFSWLYHVPNYITNGTAVANNYTLARDYSLSSGVLRYTTSTAIPDYTPSTFSQVTNVIKHLYRVSDTYSVVCSGTGSGTTNITWNPILSVDASAYYTYDTFHRPAAIWMQNTVPTNEWYFNWVHYPVPAGGTEPTITKIDNFTVAVTNGSEGDVIQWLRPGDATNATATLVVLMDLGVGGDPGTGETPGVTSRRAHAVRMNVGTIRRAP